MLVSLVSGENIFPSETVSPNPLKTVCISGHREKSIIPYMNDISYRTLTLNTVRLMLYRYIDMAEEYGFEYFISGLATGTDLWASDYIIRKKTDGSNIKFIGAVPFLRHAEFFPESSLSTLSYIEKNSDYLVTTCEDENAHYYKGSPLYRKRNYYMVDKSSAVIAFLNDDKHVSGTAQTVNYAYKNGKKIYKFSIDDVYKIIDSAGTDIQKIGKEISSMKNVFMSQ